MPGLFDSPGGGQGLFGSLANLFGGFAASQNPQLHAEMLQQQAQQATYQALQGSGVPEATARAAALNPEVLKTVAGAYFDTAPKFQVIGQNQLGIPQYGFVKSNTMEVTPAKVGGQPVSGQGDIDPTLTGEDYLKAVEQNPQLGPGKAQMIRAIGEGRVPYPSGFLLKTPFGQWLTTALGQAYPGLTAQDFQTKMATAKAFDVGTEGKAVKSVNQTILHAQHLNDIIDDLGNSTYLPSVINPAKQAYKSQFDPQYQRVRADVNNTINALATELTKSFRGNSGAIQDIEHWRQQMYDTASPETLRGGIKSAMSLLNGALTSLSEQYNSGMKSNKEPREFLNPGNRETFDKLLGGSKQQPATAGAISEGMTATNPKTGQKIMYKGGQWVPMQ